MASLSVNVVIMTPVCAINANCLPRSEICDSRDAFISLDQKLDTRHHTSRFNTNKTK